MRRLFASSAAFVLAATAGSLAAVPVSAAPPSGGWEFAGTLSAPARSATNVDITVNGSVEVDQGLLDQVAVTTSCTNPGDVPEVLPHLFRAADSSYLSITNGGLVLTPIDDTLPTSIVGATNAPTGNYELVLRFRCNSGSWSGGVSSTPAKTVTIASATSTSYLTLACVTASVSSRCTQDLTQISNVPSGTSVTFGATIKRIWSDGATTYEAASGSQSLGRTYVGGSSYSSISSSCDHATSITSSYQYRCTAGGVDYTPVTVGTITARSIYLVGSPTLSPSFAVKGASVSVSGTVQEQYSDNSYWPASASTRYSVEFQATGSTQWQTVVSSRVLTAAGSYAASFTMTGSGQVRTVVSSTTSAPVSLTELTPTETYQIGAVGLAGELPPRIAVPTSATIKVLWSDNSYRNVPDGTSATLEFAPSFDSSAAPGTLRWRVIATGTTSSGVASFSPIPQASGFWRVSVGSASGPTKYVKVTGSAESTLSATMAPGPGQQPFVGSTSAYTVSATLTGYVGTEPVGLWIDMGAGFARVATFDSANSVGGSYQVQAGATPGDVIPLLEARDTAGEVLASTTGSAIYVDGIESYQISVVAPSKPVREGSRATVVALASGTSFTGVKYAVPWSGRVIVERRTGNTWATVTTKDNAKGERLSLSVTAVDGAEYRVAWPDQDAISEAFSLKVLTPTGRVRLLQAKASPAKVVKGGRTNLTVRVRAEFSDKRFYPAPTGTKLTLQTLSGSSWKDTRSVFTRNGRAVATVKPKGSETYRFTGSGGVVSKSLAVTVVVPQASKLVVDWPSRYYYSEGAEIEVYVKSTTGGVWTGSTTLQLQYRFATYENWITLDTKSYKGRRLDWGWGSGPARTTYFRVIAPSLGLQNSTWYS